MNCCCNGGDPAPSDVDPRRPVARTGSWSGRAGAFFQWALPLAVLALVPKCPGCVAAYVLLVTGIGLSHPAAAHLRTGIIAASAASLALVAAAATCRLLRRVKTGASAGCL